MRTASYSTCRSATIWKASNPPKVDAFIEGMKDASATPIWNEIIGWARANASRFAHVDEAFIDSITPQVSRSITESTLHGCPPDEIERIATYLIEEKGLDTYVKCNPTLLGYEFARAQLDALGFDYIAFDDHHFVEDLQWADAVPMFQRLIKRCADRGLEFGVKLTNTFPVDVTAHELPSEEMYMSGRSLFPLSISLAAKIAREFDGALCISYSGGADAHSIKRIVDAGIWPVTMATDELKPGGDNRFAQIAGILADGSTQAFAGQDVAAVEKLAEDALNIILERNALPHITSTICPHHCGDTCMRTYYEGAVRIREAKLEATQKAYEQVLPTLKTRGTCNRTVAVVGAGPAGMACAAFLSRAGAQVTVFERANVIGGVVAQAIPAFRISDEAIERDATLCKAFGAQFKLGSNVQDVAVLKAQGFDDVVVAIGAWAPGAPVVASGDTLDAIAFLTVAKNAPETLELGTDVVVIGGGNTAMDVARAAKRLPGVQHVRLVYRRTKRYMPADEEELAEAIADGVEFMELLAPSALADGTLTCSVMELGAPDESGRRSPQDTGKTVQVPATAVIAAVGERVDGTLFTAAGITLDRKGLPEVDENLQCAPGVYAIGDCRRGPKTVVEAEADAATVAHAITGFDFNGKAAANVAADDTAARAKKGLICLNCDTEYPCLGCATVCETCCDVCPNRANVSIKVPGSAQTQVVHVDGMCNECGNCAVFCPYEGRPYKDKFTLFWSEEDFDNSENEGFLPLDDGCLVRLDGKETTCDDTLAGIPDEVRAIIRAIQNDYPYLLA